MFGKAKVWLLAPLLLVLVHGIGCRSDEICIYPECSPEDVDLASYALWRAETGYYIGEYTFLGPDGEPYETESWPYRYDNYRGFITGNVEGNRYRQRNVFFYPPQLPELYTAANN